MHSNPIENDKAVDHTKIPFYIPAGNAVWTQDGYKPAESLSTHDAIWTTEQGFQIVLDNTIQDVRETYCIDTMAIDSLVVSSEQQLYAIKHRRHWSHERREEQVTFGAPEWVRGKDLDRSYYIGAAINQEAILAEGAKQYTAQASFWYVVGLCLREGWTEKEGEVTVRLRMETIQHLLTTLDAIDWTYAIEKTVNGYDLTLYHSVIIHCLKTAGNDRHTQQLPTDWIRMPQALVRSFIDGYFYVHDASTDRQLRVLRHPNRLFLYGLAQCVAKAYERPFGLYRNQQSSTGGYRLQFSLEGQSSVGGFFHNGIVWSPVYQVHHTTDTANIHCLSIQTAGHCTVGNLIIPTGSL